MAHPETLPTPSVDPPDVWGATLNTAIGNIDDRLDADETAENADIQVIRRSGSDWIWRGQVVTARPTLPAGTRVLWVTDSEAGFVTPPDLAVAYDMWKPHKDAVTSPPAAESGGITAVAAEAAYVRKDGSTMTGALVVPAPTAASHVPRLARTPNAATGDLGLPGFDGSDTGERNVNDLLSSGWTISPAWVGLQRIGRTVEVRIGQSGFLTATSVANDVMLTLPTGFRPSQTIVSALLDGGEVVRRVVVGANGSLAVIGATGGTKSYRGIIRFFAAPAWPASLPGTQVTAPASWS